jgi:predicted secreted protein
VTDPEVIRLRPGEGHVLSFPGMGAAGYEWSFDVEGDAEAVAVVRRPASGEGGGGGARDLPAGGSLPERFAIVARAPGRTTVHFAQRRRWEVGVPPLEERTIDVEVVNPPTQGG